MAKKALILNNQIVDVVATEFEVASTMTWIDCPDDCKVGEWELNGSGNPVAKTPLADDRTYAEKRFDEYPSMREQLDDIYHNGIDAWKATIKTTKDKYPKP